MAGNPARVRQNKAPYIDFWLETIPLGHILKPNKFQTQRKNTFYFTGISNRPADTFCCVTALHLIQANKHTCVSEFFKSSSILVHLLGVNLDCEPDGIAKLPAEEH